MAAGHVIPMSSHASTRRDAMAFQVPGELRINDLALGSIGRTRTKRLRFPLALPSLPKDINSLSTSRQYACYTLLHSGPYHPKIIVSIEYFSSCCASRSPKPRPPLFHQRETNAHRHGR